MSTLNEKKFKDSWENRRAKTRGVTLVAYWKDSKPSQFKALLDRVEASLRSNLDTNWFDTYSAHVHATLTGLEGKRSPAGGIINNNLSDRLRAVGGVAPPVNSKGILTFLRDSPWPIQVQIGGFSPTDRNPYDPDRPPFQRTFEIREDGLMVMMGWPLLISEKPFAPLLLGVRKYIERFGVVHKWHTNPLSQDNDLFIVVGEVNYNAWHSDRERIQHALDEAQARIRTDLAASPTHMPLALEHLWTIGYSYTTLADTWKETPVLGLDSREFETFF